MSSAERKTTGSTFMIGCVVKTKERLPMSSAERRQLGQQNFSELRRKEDLLWFLPKTDY